MASPGTYYKCGPFTCENPRLTPVPIIPFLPRCFFFLLNLWFSFSPDSKVNRIIRHATSVLLLMSEKRYKGLGELQQILFIRKTIASSSDLTVFMCRLWLLSSFDIVSESSFLLSLFVECTEELKVVRLAIPILYSFSLSVFYCSISHSPHSTFSGI